MSRKLGATVDQQTEERISGLVSRCHPGLSRVMAEAMAVQPDFSAQDWMEVHRLCGEPRRGARAHCYTMQVVAPKKAIEVASTLADWISIAEGARGEHRHLAFEKIREYKISTVRDVDMLLNSSCERLQTIGWYLKGNLDLLR